MNFPKKVSQYVSYEELVGSNTAKAKGIDNTPTKEIFENAVVVASEVFDPLRVWAGGPLGINSFYRCPALNTAVGGSPTSDHVYGHAIDIDADKYSNGKTNRELFLHIVDNLDFDQVIWEYGQDPKNPLKNCQWVHVSKRKSGNRKKITIKLSGQPYRSPTAKEMEEIRRGSSKT